MRPYGSDPARETLWLVDPLTAVGNEFVARCKILSPPSPPPRRPAARPHPPSRRAATRRAAARVPSVSGSARER